jgi:hypothetical protein
MFQSDDRHDARQGFEYLCQITDGVARSVSAQEARNGITYITRELIKLMSLFLGTLDEYHSGLGMIGVQRIDTAVEETAFYFNSMFKAGHFEQLPMPDFFYDSAPKLIVERRVLDDQGRASIKGPLGH